MFSCRAFTNQALGLPVSGRASLMVGDDDGYCVHIFNAAWGLLVQWVPNQAHAGIATFDSCACDYSSW